LINFLDILKLNTPKKKLLLGDGLWLLLQHGIKFLVGFFVTLYLARYLGPEEYGLFSLSISYILLFSIFSDLGLSEILVRDFVSKKDTELILSTSLILRTFGGFLSILFLLFFLKIFQEDSILVKSVIILSPIIIFKCFDSINNFFQSLNKNKFVALATIFSIIVGAIFTLVFIKLKKDYYYFISVYLFEFILLSICLLFFYIIFYKKLTIRFSFKKAKEMLFESWPLIIAGASSVISTRIDQIFIGNMLSQNVLGNYSAAAKISEVWLILPMIYGRVIYPSLVQKKTENQNLYKTIVWKTILLFFIVGISGAGLITIFSDSLINILFGTKYDLASTYLSYYIWSTLPYFVLFIVYQLFYIEKIVQFGLIVSITSIVSNLTLNYFLIDLFGAKGAIIGTLIATCLSYIITFVILRVKTNFFK